MKVIKENLIVTGYELNQLPSFVNDFKKATNKDWGFWGLKSNHKRHGVVTEIYRYFLYFFYSLCILLNSRKLKNVITTQQFYGLIVAFYLRLFHLKKRFSLTVLTFIYKPKKSLIGGAYFKFMKWIVNSKYIDGIIVYSANEVKYYEDIFKCRKGLFHYVQLGKSDESTSLKNEKGSYIISVGRSNRDYDFLMSSLKDTKYKLVIVNDSFSSKAFPDNVEVLTSCYKEEMLELMAKSFCVVVPLQNPKISAGQLVILQGQNLHKPVISTDSEGVKNYIQDGKTGFIIPKSKDELLRTLAKLEDDVLYNEIAENAYNAFMDNYSVSKQFKSIGHIVNSYMM